MRSVLPCLLVILLIGCYSVDRQPCKIGPPERHYDFFADIKRQSNSDYLEAIVDFRQFGSLSQNLWIRKPENLKLVYSSLKQIGLKRFISTEEFNEPLFTDHWKESSWEGKSLNQLVQHLISSSDDTSGYDKYFIEFWNRRRADKNYDAVLQILKDINGVYNPEESTAELDWITDPVLTGLFGFEARLKEDDSPGRKNTCTEYFKYLKSIGLHASANNLIRHEYQTIQDRLEKQDEDLLELINQMETDTVSCEVYWEWRQSAGWFTEINDYNL